MLGLQLIVLVFCAMGIEAEYIYHRKAGGSLKHHKRPATWQEARMRCHLEGTVLASPLNTGLREVLEETSRNDYIFVGFHAIFSKGDFFSIEGLPIEKSALTFQPNNYKNKEDCVAMNSFGVMDVPCDDLLPYLCFKEGVPKTVENGPCGPIDNGQSLAKAGYSRFIHGKPNGSGGCLAMRHDDGLLNNVDCGSIHPFFCEKLPY